MKKILIISQYFWPENFRINDIFFKLLKDKNYDVTVITTYPSYQKKYKWKDQKKIIRVFSFSRGSSKFSIILSYLSFLLSSTLYALFLYKNKPDYVFAFQTSPVTSVLASLIFKFKFKSKIVCWVLDIWPDSAISLGLKSKIFISFLNKISKFIYSNFDYLLASTKTSVNLLKKRYKNKVLYFPNWFQKDKVRKFNSGLNLKNLNIIFTGNIGPAQDFDTVINSTNLLKKKKIKFQWVIVGSGSEINKLKKKIIDKNLTNFFVFFNFLSVDKSNYLTKICDVAFITLKKNSISSKTLPGKVQNYMVLGKPLLGIGSDEIKKIIMMSRSGYYGVNDKDLAKKILKLNNNKKKNKILGKNAKNFVTNNFSFKNNINILRRLFV